MFFCGWQASGTDQIIAWDFANGPTSSNAARHMDEIVVAASPRAGRWHKVRQMGGNQRVALSNITISPALIPAQSSHYLGIVVPGGVHNGEAWQALQSSPQMTLGAHAADGGPSPYTKQSAEWWLNPPDESGA